MNIEKITNTMKTEMGVHELHARNASRRMDACEPYTPVHLESHVGPVVLVRRAEFFGEFFARDGVVRSMPNPTKPAADPLPRLSDGDLERAINGFVREINWTAVKRHADRVSALGTALAMVDRYQRPFESGGF